MLEQGQTIADRYQVLEELGRGGMGAVYRVEDTQLERIAALKILAPHLVWDEKFVKRFVREAKTAARLQHPNIVAIYEVNQIDDLYYIAMEFAAGQPLDQIIEQGQTLELAQIAGWLRQVASALDHAHAHDLVHRDVKPANIIVRPDGRLALTDFGIAWTSDATRLTSTGQVGLGTPFYSSPEQIKGEDPSAKSDIYSLGVVAYELLAGKPPFTGDTMTLLYAHVHETPPPLDETRPDLPDGVERVLNKALAKDPAQRFKTASALADAFAVACGLTSPFSDPQQTQLAGSGPVTMATQPKKSGSRPWGLVAAGLAAVIILCLLGFGLTTWGFFGGAEDQEAAQSTTQTTPASASGSASLGGEEATSEPGTAAPTATPSPAATVTETAPSPTEPPTAEPSPTVAAGGVAGDAWTGLSDNLGLSPDVERKHVAVAVDPDSGALSVGWFQPGSGLRVTTSADGGQSWSGIGLASDIEDESDLPQLGHYWLAYGQAGQLYAGWVERSSTEESATNVLSALSQNNGSAWQQPVIIDDESRQPAYRYDLRLAPLPQERLAAAWAEGADGFEIYFSTSQAENTGWSDDEPIAAFNNAVFLGDLIRYEDTLFLGLVEKDDEGDILYLLVSEDLGQSWQSPRKISDDFAEAGYSAPQLAALGPDEVVILASAETGDDETPPQVVAALLETGSKNRPALQSLLDENGQTATEVGRVDLSLNEAGLLYAAWSDNRDGLLRPYLALSEDGQSWSPNLAVGQSETPQFDVSLATDPAGQLFAVGGRIPLADEEADEEPPAQLFVARSQPDPEAESPAERPTSTPIPTPEASPTPEGGGVYQLAYTKWDGQFHNVYIANTSGGGERLFFSRAAGPSFAPNGRRLYFFGEQGVNQQFRAGENRVICEFNTISGGIVAVDLRYPIRDICQIQFDTWFCERKRIDVNAEPSDVCTANGVSVYQNLDWKDGTARWAKVAPDNLAVAFDGRPSGDTYRLYFRNVVGTSRQAKIEILGEQGSWSPGGRQMVYRSGRNNQQGLWVSNRDDTGHRLLTNNGTDSFPAWSPDGSTIAFSRDVGGNVDIYTVNTAGGNLRRLTDAPGPDTLPVYTPSGQLIFRSARGGGWAIWKMNGDGSNQQLIIPNAGVGPDWAFSRMDVQ